MEGGLFIRFVRLILYSSIWISLAAVAMMQQTLLWIGESGFHFPLAALVFGATLVIYAMHRVVGLQKSLSFTEKGRFGIIKKYRSHIIGYAALGAIGMLVSLFYLKWQTILVLILPGFISVGYVIPVFGRKKFRLRDFDFVKIFLVAGVWTWVAVILPLVEMDAWSDPNLMIPLCLETFLFVFAITIPFDIRDLGVDGHNQVQTLPAILGIKTSKIIALLLLVMAFVCSVFIFIPFSGTPSGEYAPYPILIFRGIGYIITGFLIGFSSPEKPDHYYTGYLDGTMILLPFCSFSAIWSGL